MRANVLLILAAACWLLLVLAEPRTEHMWFLYLMAGLTVPNAVLSIIVTARQPRPPDDLSETHIRQALQRGDRSTAIRWYRKLHAVGERRAVEAINVLAAQEASINKTSKRVSDVADPR